MTPLGAPRPSWPDSALWGPRRCRRGDENGTANGTEPRSTYPVAVQVRRDRGPEAHGKSRRSATPGGLAEAVSIAGPRGQDDRALVKGASLGAGT
jgi:hypothetical protein